MKGFAARYLKRPALILVVCGGVLAFAGILYAVLAGLGGGGQAWGSRSSAFSSGKYEQSDMQFGWVVVGVVLFALGIAVLKD